MGKMTASGFSAWNVSRTLSIFLSVMPPKFLETRTSLPQNPGRPSYTFRFSVEYVKKTPLHHTVAFLYFTFLRFGFLAFAADEALRVLFARMAPAPFLLMPSFFAILFCTF